MIAVRGILIVVAIITGGNAVGAWAFGNLHAAGILGAITGAAVLVSEGIAFSHRRYARDWDRRAARERHPVGKARRESYALEDVFAARARLWDERKPVVTTMTYDEHGEPISGYDSLGHSGVWPFELGAPE